MRGSILIDGKLFCHGYTHSIITCVSGDQCTRIGGRYGYLWKPCRRKSSLIEGNPSWVLLVNCEGGLHEVYTTMRVVSEAC